MYRELVITMKKEGACSQPRARVVYVDEVMVTTSTRSYHPRGVLLHRCGSDSGCCEDPRMECMPAKMDKVSKLIAITLSSRNCCAT